MQTEEDAINEAYADAIKQLYATMLDGLVTTGSDFQATAVRRFLTGFLLAKNTRVLALQAIKQESEP